MKLCSKSSFFDTRCLQRVSYCLLKIQVPFKKYFKVEPLREYHRVMTMEDFMSDLAPTIWPVGKRIGNITHSSIYV